jgi:hypothetical protein
MSSERVCCGNFALTAALVPSDYPTPALTVLWRCQHRQ